MLLSTLFVAAGMKSALVLLEDLSPARPQRLSACASTQEGSGTSAVRAACGWGDDLEALRRELPARHGSPWHETTQADFEQAVESLSERLPELDDATAALELARITAMIGDGHTELQLFGGPKEFSRLPLLLYQFEDELRVIGAREGFEDLLGARIVRFGRLEAGEALLSIRPYLARDNAVEYLHQAPTTLASPEVLHGLGATDSPREAELELELESGEHVVRLVSPATGVGRGVALLQARGVPPPVLARRPRSYYWFTTELEDLVCFQSNVSNDQPDGPAIEAVADEFFAAVDRLHPRAVVVDVRNNSGGNDYRNEPLVRGLESRPEYCERGRLYVLVGRRTFSAGLGLARGIEGVAHPILVGEPSRGNPQVRVNREEFVLPFSGYRVDYSEEFETTGYPRPELKIDLSAPPTYTAFVEGVDPGVEAIRRHMAEGGR